MKKGFLWAKTDSLWGHGKSNEAARKHLPWGGVEAAFEDAKVVSPCRFLDISTSIGFVFVVVWKSQPQSFDEPLLLEAAVFKVQVSDAEWA